jgi:hypothetical protein
MIIYWSWKHDENTAPPQNETLLTKVGRIGKTLVYYITHFPSVVRWNRLAHVIH